MRPGQLDLLISVTKMPAAVALLADNEVGVVVLVRAEMVVMVGAVVTFKSWLRKHYHPLSCWKRGVAPEAILATQDKPAGLGQGGRRDHLGHGPSCGCKIAA